MKLMTKIQGKTIPLARNDVDTDLIIPAQYLTGVTKAGYGENLFKRLRENDPEFVFNQAQYKDANILITQNNFGCGSSREHAVWALQEAGIEAVVAISFADIFFNNSAKNGLMLITLPETVINKMIANSNGDYQVSIDIEQQRVESSVNEAFEFSMDPFRKHCFMNGLDDLDYLLNNVA